MLVNTQSSLLHVLIFRKKRDGDKTHKFLGELKGETNFKRLNSGNRHTNQCALTHAYTYVHVYSGLLNTQTLSYGLSFHCAAVSLNMHQSSSIYCIGNCCFGVK